MAELEIRGGSSLHGTVRAAGSKNAALPMMAAALLTDEPVELIRAPKLADVDSMADLLRGLGVRVETTHAGVRLQTVDSRVVRPDDDLISSMRAGFCVLGPLLARRGEATAALPGGCELGSRPVDLHLKGLAALGAQITVDGGLVTARCKRLQGAAIDLSGPRGSTVTGTANVLSAAVLAEGKTEIRGAALEPEIEDLGRLLVAMGARIAGLGTSTLRIEGVRQLGGAIHAVIPDRIETATLLIAAAITRGRVCVAGARPQHLETVLDCLRAAGAAIEASLDRITVACDRPLTPQSVIGKPYPGFPTDLQAQWTALAAVLPGECTVRDEVFPDRFAHVEELARLGASIRREGNAAIISGVDRLTGGRVTASDLRASAALVLAGLLAEGQTTVLDAGHLDRGYESLDEKLNALGADISRRR